MLERIHAIKTVGLLHNATASKHAFKEINLIYANNGRGKSTLASIFRSYNLNKSDIITSRKTFGKTDEQVVDLQFSLGKKAKFSNGAWDGKQTDILVFDLDFVENNIYSGGEVSPTQRKNLLKFALGTHSVVAQKEYELANQNLITCMATTKSCKDVLSGHHGGITLPAYIKIKKDPDADTKIIALNEKVSAARNNTAIQNRILIKKITVPQFDMTSFFATLSNSLKDIDLEAEGKVKEHIAKHAPYELEGWLNSGINFTDGETCPFCGQNTDGLEILSAYRSYFNQEYKKLINKISELKNIFEPKTSKEVVNFIVQQHSEAKGISDSWSEYVPGHFNGLNGPALDDFLSQLRQKLSNLNEKKIQSPLENVLLQDDVDTCLALWEKFVNEILIVNNSIDERNLEIDKFKLSLLSESIPTLESEIALLNRIKSRYTQPVVSLLDDYNEAKKTEDAAIETKAAKKATLDKNMEQVLSLHETEINSLLKIFGASFQITKIAFNYAGGGEPKSEYILSMPGQDIPITAQTGTLGKTLSEGDRRTLAFAFFMAVVKRDPDLNKKIIVLDDPMCSFDSSRKHQTTMSILELQKKCKQVIVLAHDIYFIKKIRDETIKSKNEALLKILELSYETGNYSNFSEINIDEECESEFFKNHRMIREFLSGKGDKTQVSRSIRPMLEGYLHRRFPGILKQGNMFGQSLIEIKESSEGSPLFYAKNLVGDLNSINSYVSRFHHDTNPDYATEPVDEQELRNYCTQSLELIYKG